MKTITLLICLTFLVSCNESKNENQTTETKTESVKPNDIEKMIKQNIISRGMGMIKIKELTNVKKVSDNIYTATHSFTNPVMEMDVRVTNHYYFNSDLKAIDSLETVKAEMFIEGDWIESSY